MNKPLADPVPASTEEAQVRWAAEYAAQIGSDQAVHNRSGIPVKPLYTPPWQEIRTVVKLAVEEDVDVIGLSSLATDHLIVPKLMTALREAGLSDVAVIVGGIVPDEDEQMLLDAGVARVFHPGSPLEDISAYITDATARVRAARFPA